MHAWVVWLRKKGGDGTDTNHNRSVCKLDHYGKGYFAQLTKRVTNLFRRVAPACFFAYLPKRSGLMAIAAVEEAGRRFIRRVRKSVPRGLRGCSLALLGLDLSKAFDKVSRKQLWEAFEQQLPLLLGILVEYQAV